MGQVNCQCQQALLQQSDWARGDDKKAVHLSPPVSSEETEVSQMCSRVVLSNHQGCWEIRLREGERTTFGTTADCEQRPISNSLNSFKMQVRVSSHHLTVRDCGVGFGVFLLKKKAMIKCEGREMLFSLQESFLMVRISPDEQIAYSVFGLEGEQSGSVGRGELTIEVGQLRVVLRREREGRQYSLRRQDRGWLCVLLSEERRVRGGDVLRLGCEFFQVESINSCLKPSQAVYHY